MGEFLVHLPDDLTDDLRRIVKRKGLEESEVLVACIRDGFPLEWPPKPHTSFFDTGDPHMSEKVDELLKGFGEHDLPYEPEDR